MVEGRPLAPSQKMMLLISANAGVAGRPKGAGELTDISYPKSDRALRQAGSQSQAGPLRRKETFKESSFVPFARFARPARKQRQTKQPTDQPLFSNREKVRAAFNAALPNFLSRTGDARG